MTREYEFPWIRAGFGYARNEFGIGINALMMGSLSAELKLGSFYVWIEIDGKR